MAPPCVIFAHEHLFRGHPRQRRSAGGTGVRDGLCRPVARQGAERKGCANLRRYGGGKVAIAYSHPSIMVCRSEEHTSELQSLMRNSYAVFCLKKKKKKSHSKT